MSWIPFGAGPRQCVGMRLGLSEAKTALAHLLRRYDLVAGVETEVRLTLRFFFIFKSSQIQKELNILGCTTTSPEAVTLYLKPRI